jgi:hypothetical protein
MMTADDRDIEVVFTSRGEPATAELADRLEQLLAVANGEATTAFRNATNNESEWKKAFSNPGAYLESHGVALPERVTVALQERPTPAIQPSSTLAYDNVELRPVPPAVLEALCEKAGGRLVWRTSCKEMCKKWVEYWECKGNPTTGDETCWLVRRCLDRGMECEGEWVCSSSIVKS